MWKEKRKKNIISVFFTSPLFLSLVLLGLLAAIGFPLYKNLSSRYRIDKEIEDLKVEIDGLESGNRDLKKLLTYLKSDQFAEAEARLNFGLKKNGEEVVVVKEEGQAAVDRMNDNNSDEELSAWAKWVKYFWGKK
jgi:cell division protein FtsB